MHVYVKVGSVALNAYSVYVVMFLTKNENRRTATLLSIASATILVWTKKTPARNVFFFSRGERHENMYEIIVFRQG